MATDPYAAIRRLKSTQTPIYGDDWYSGDGDPAALGYTQRDIGTGEASDIRWWRQGAQTGSSDDLDVDWMSSALKPYQSKFQRDELLPDGRRVLTLQQPGAHKYDLMQAVYAKDPTTGEWVLQNDPMQATIKQQSSKTRVGQGIGTVAGVLAAPMLGPGLSSALGGGILGGAGAGAILGGGGALASGSDSQGALKAAVGGGVAGGVMAGLQGQGWTGSPVDPVQPIDLPANYADVSNITNPIDAALARQIPQLDASGSLSQGLQSFGGAGTPWSYGGSGLDPNVLTGGGNALTGGYIPPQQGMPSLLGPISDAATGEPVRFETTGQRMPTDQMKGFAPMPEIGAQVPPLPTNAQAGITPAAPISLPSIPALAPIGGAGGSIIDKIIGNPLQAATIGAGLLAGSQEQGGGTATRTSQIDPRMAEALYGAGGFLPAAQDWYAQNKSGTNDTIKQGQQMQMGLLTDPRVNQQLEQMRTQSMGLLGRPVANNPFLRG